MSKDMEALRQVLAHLDPYLLEGLELYDKHRDGRLDQDHLTAHLRQLAKQKRGREAKQRLEEMKAFMDKYIKEAKRRGQL